MTPEQRAARLHYHLYETCEGIREHAERIVALEELALLNWEWAQTCCADCRLRDDYCGCAVDRECNFEREVWNIMRELGVMDE